MIKLITWNINGFFSTYKKGDFINIFKGDYEYICLQEIKNNDLNLIRSIVPQNYFLYYNFSKQKGKNGVIVLSKTEAIDCSKILGENNFDLQGRFLNLKYHDFRLINLYLPHGGRDKKNLVFKLNSAILFLKLLKHYKNEKIIIGTDFNIAHNEKDVFNAKVNRNNIMFTQEERLLIDKLLDLEFVDAYRYLFSNANDYSWWTYAFKCRERNIGWRIDYWFVANCLKDRIVDVTMLRNIYGSDHCPVELTLR